MAWPTTRRDAQGRVWLVNPDGNDHVLHGFMMQANKRPWKSFQDTLLSVGTMKTSWNTGAVRVMKGVVGLPISHPTVPSLVEATSNPPLTLATLVAEARSKKQFVKVMSTHMGWWNGSYTDLTQRGYSQTMINELVAELPTQADQEWVVLQIMPEPGTNDMGDATIGLWQNAMQYLITYARNAGWNGMISVTGHHGGQDQWRQVDSFNTADSAILTYGSNLTDPAARLIFNVESYGLYWSRGANNAARAQRVVQFIQAVNAKTSAAAPGGFHLFVGDLDFRAAYASTLPNVSTAGGQVEYGALAWCDAVRGIGVTAQPQTGLMCWVGDPHGTPADNAGEMRVTTNSTFRVNGAYSQQCYGWALNATPATGVHPTNLTAAGEQIWQAFATWTQGTTGPPPSTITPVYVSSTGSDSNDGSSAVFPVLSLDKALSLVTSGGEIRCKPGNYGTQTIANRNPAAKVTIKVDPANPGLVSFSSGSYNSGHGIRVDTCSNIIFDGVQARTSRVALGIYSSHDIDVLRGSFFDVGQNCILVRAQEGGGGAVSYNILIEGNACYDTGKRTDIANPERRGEGIYVGLGDPAGTDYTGTVTIRDNDIYNTTAEAIDLKPGTSYSVVEDNLIHDCYVSVSAALVVHIGSVENNDANTIIRRNKIWNIFTHPLSVGANGRGMEISSGLTQVYNNIIWNCDGIGLWVDNLFYGPNTNVKLWFNTVHNNGGGDIVITTGGSPATVEASNNIGLATAGNVASSAVFFVNVGNGDLHLVPTATAAINTGGAVGSVTTDFDGSTRSNPPDMGAFEYTAQLISLATGVTTAPAIGAATVANDQTVTLATGVTTTPVIGAAEIQAGNVITIPTTMMTPTFGDLAVVIYLAVDVTTGVTTTPAIGSVQVSGVNSSIEVTSTTHALTTTEPVVVGTDEVYVGTEQVVTFEDGFIGDGTEVRFFTRMIFEPPVAAVISRPQRFSGETPPSEVSWGAHNLSKYFNDAPMALTVMRIGSQWVAISTPTTDEIEMADRVYMGGHVYDITDEERIDLLAAGYEVQYV